jgi:hypothetical protein
MLLEIFGAALGAIGKIIPKWPEASLAAAERPSDTPLSATIVVVNPAHRPLFIEGSHQWPTDRPRLRIFERRSLDERQTQEAFFDTFRSPEQLPRLVVPAEGTAYLTVSDIPEGTDLTIILWWHRNWVFHWLPLPVPVRVTSDRVAMLNRQ